jgi:hypothetical protein
VHLLLTSRAVLDMLGQVGDARHTGPPRTTSCTVDKNVISFNQRHPSRPDGSGGGNNVSVKPGKCLPKDSPIAWPSDCFWIRKISRDPHGLDLRFGRSCLS